MCAIRMTGFLLPFPFTRAMNAARPGAGSKICVSTPAAVSTLSRYFATCISFPGGFTVLMRISRWRCSTVCGRTRSQSGSCAMTGMMGVKKRAVRSRRDAGRGTREADQLARGATATRRVVRLPAARTPRAARPLPAARARFTPPTGAIPSRARAARTRAGARRRARRAPGRARAAPRRRADSRSMGPLADCGTSPRRTAR